MASTDKKANILAVNWGSNPELIIIDEKKENL
jgi:hypothetical protein